MSPRAFAIIGIAAFGVLAVAFVAWWIRLVWRRGSKNLDHAATNEEAVTHEFLSNTP